MTPFFFLGYSFGTSWLPLAGGRKLILSGDQFSSQHLQRLKACPPLHIISKKGTRGVVHITGKISKEKEKKKFGVMPSCICNNTSHVALYVQVLLTSMSFHCRRDISCNIRTLLPLLPSQPYQHKAESYIFNL